MDSEKLKELFNKAKPENIELNNNKFELRRQLLNSDQFNIPLWQQIIGMGYAVRITAAFILFILIFITNFSQREISAKDIIKKLDKLYGAPVQPKKVNYCEGTMVIYDDIKGVVKFKFENWKDPNTGKTKFIRKDINTDEILDYKVFNGAAVYSSSDSCTKIIRMEKFNPDENIVRVDLSKKKKNVKFFYSNNSKNSNISAITNSKNNSTLSLTLATNDSNTLKCKSGGTGIFVSTRFIDVDKMTQETPTDIALRIKSGNIIMLGGNYDESFGRNIIVIQREVPVDSMKLDKIYVNVNVNSKNAKNKSSRSEKEKMKSLLDGNISLGHKREIITLDSQTGKIYKLVVKIIHSDKEETLSEMTFYQDRIIDLEESFFESSGKDINPQENSYKQRK